MLIRLSTALTLGGIVVFAALPALAGSTGLEAIHTLKREGGRLCMDGHFHYGADGSPNSKARALKNAKRAWADFVHLEYGSDWARFSLSANKGIKCTGAKGEGYHCSVKARPCKALGRKLRHAKRKRTRKARHSTGRRHRR